MKSMKENGAMDIQNVRARAERLQAMGRIGTEDCEYIRHHCKKIEARIVEMIETNGTEEF